MNKLLKEGESIDLEIEKTQMQGKYLLVIRIIHVNSGLWVNDLNNLCLGN